MELQEQIAAYLSLDQNKTTLDEAKKLIQEGDQQKLQKYFGTRLEFGTAGLRAEMGCGFSRMNQLTIIQTTQGLAQYLLDTVPNCTKMGVVLGRDHRHNSNEFQQLTAAVFMKFGFKVYYYKNIVHTPLVPYSVSKLKAACGIMITASHNPKMDNGYKVYWGNGCQIIPPHDSNIAQSILENLTPTTWDMDMHQSSVLCENPEYLIPEYFKEISKLSHFKANNQIQSVKFCYTAMHGVGYEFADQGFKSFNLPEFHSTPAQKLPNPEFPTVVFPNPEEKGALDLSMEYAKEQNCDIILANDPDADRFATAEYQKSSNSWYVFTGNEIGILLASFILESIPESELKTSAVLTTTVSSHMLGAMAKDKGVYFTDTLTGFKWLGNKAQDLEAKGIATVFAFEEAIGYMCSTNIKDKDGVSAMAVFGEWANDLYSRKLTMYDHLVSLYQKYGYWVSNNAYYFCYDKGLINKIFDKIRYGENAEKDGDKFEFKLNYPKTIGGFKVVSVRDLTIGYDSNTVDNIPELPSSKSTQMVTFKLENECLITLRTSGTEPKIKYYTELKGEALDLARETLGKIVLEMCEQLLQPGLNKIKMTK